MVYESERENVSQIASVSSSIASRYARALFEIVKNKSSIDILEKNVGHLSKSLNESVDFVSLIKSPIFTRRDQEKAIYSVGKKMSLMPEVLNTLCLMAQKRRLFVLPEFLEKLIFLISDHKNEINAFVTAARPLTEKQKHKLSEVISASLKKNVKINEIVDESIIGGLVVKIESKMVDSTIQSRLNFLKNIMKEVV